MSLKKGEIEAIIVESFRYTPAELSALKLWRKGVTEEDISVVMKDSVVENNILHQVRNEIRDLTKGIKIDKN